MDLTTFAQRVRRADFLDGLGIYVEAEQVSIAHVTKRLLRVALRRERTYPLAPTSRRPERVQTLTQALGAFIHERNISPGVVHLCLARQELLLNRLVLPAATRENLRQVLEYVQAHPLVGVLVGNGTEGQAGRNRRDDVLRIG